MNRLERSDLGSTVPVVVQNLCRSLGYRDKRRIRPTSAGAVLAVVPELRPQPSLIRHALAMASRILLTVGM